MKKKNLIIIICIVVGLIVLLLWLFREKKFLITINNQEFLISSSDNRIINLQMFSTEKNIIINCKDKCDGLSINGVEFVDNKVTLTELVISKQNKIIVDYNGKIIATINTLPENFPEYSFEGQSSTVGDYYIATYNDSSIPDNYIIKLNNKGEIIFYKKTNLAFDFDKVITSDNKIRYTYLETITEQNEDISSILYTNLVVMDENYNIINKIRYDDNNYLENHSYIYFNDNEYIVASYEVKTVNNIPQQLSHGEQTEVIANKIKLVKNNNTVWEFDTTNYEELYLYSTFSNRYDSKAIGEKDYIHVNSLTIDPDDGNLLVSFRNIDAIIKIDINDGKLLWILGGIGDEFSLSDSQLFYKQHSISFSKDGKLNIFDNGVDVLNTRIVRLKYDESEKKITDFESYKIYGLSTYMGSVQILEDNIALICHGGNNYISQEFEERNLTDNSLIVKFSFDNDLYNYMYKVNKRK